MDKKTEKKLEKKVGKKLSKQIGREVEAEMEKEVKKEVAKEVKKRLHERIYGGARERATAFNKEFKNEIAVGITAAFAFLIALSWRGPIQKSVDSLVVSLGLTGKAIYVEYLSALIMTLIAVLVLMLVSRWKVKEEE
tara:strand:+ start:285 stop:695 length:411 start_codon:yes stop_codon:yes gene_type:complete